MHFNWNKRVLASSFAVLSMMTTATSLYAIPKGPCDRTKEDVCCEAPKPGPFAFAYPLDLGLNCPRDFYIHVDGLAFQAKQDGMDFAIEDATSSAGVPTAPLNAGKVVGFSNDNSDWDWNPGMRFGFGFFLDHDAWNIDFNWTWLNITDYKHASASTAGNLLVPLWMLGSSDDTAGCFGSTASAVWKAHYNTIDLSLGKPFYVSRYFVVNPSFGLRGGWIDQHFSVHYGSPVGSSGTVHHGDNHFWGVGLRMGVASEWVVGKGWCLFANAFASTMASKFEIKQRMVLPTSVTTHSNAITSTNDGFDFDYDYYQNTPNTEMAVGVAWSKYFDRSKYRIGLKASYEFIEWWDQLNMRRFFSGAPGYANDTVSRGNLTLNGFSLKVQLDI